MDAALYARQNAWKDLSTPEADAFFLALAGEIGLDVTEWQADYGSTDVKAIVNTNRQASIGMGLNRTPTLFIGGSLYTGSFSSDGIRTAIEAAAPST